MSKDHKGSSATEYAILLCGVSLLAASGVVMSGTEVSSIFSSTAEVNDGYISYANGSGDDPSSTAEDDEEGEYLQLGLSITDETVSVFASGSDVSVDWGDGTVAESSSDIQSVFDGYSTYSGQLFSHTYSDPGYYTVSVGPSVNYIQYSDGGDGATLEDIISFGDVGLESLGYSFLDSGNIKTVPADLPPGVTNLQGTFMYNPEFGMGKSVLAGVSTWDVSNVTDISRLFYKQIVFNQDVGSWDVRNVTDMSETFYSAIQFDQNIGAWDVSNVSDMYRMFSNAQNFNQNLSTWEFTAGPDMQEMFYNAQLFNQDISTWDVSHISNMYAMFGLAKSFNQDISYWDVSSASNMDFMFFNASKFDQDLSSWCVPNIESEPSNFGIDEAYQPNWGDASCVSSNVGSIVE